MPLSAVMDDLRVTRSVDFTIENILEGRLQAPPVSMLCILEQDYPKLTASYFHHGVFDIFMHVHSYFLLLCFMDFVEISHMHLYGKDLYRISNVLITCCRVMTSDKC